MTCFADRSDLGLQLSAISTCRERCTLPQHAQANLTGRSAAPWQS